MLYARIKKISQSNRTLCCYVTVPKHLSHFVHYLLFSSFLTLQCKEAFIWAICLLTWRFEEKKDLKSKTKQKTTI